MASLISWFDISVGLLACVRLNSSSTMNSSCSRTKFEEIIVKVCVLIYAKFSYDRFYAFAGIKIQLYHYKLNCLVCRSFVCLFLIYISVGSAGKDFVQVPPESKCPFREAAIKITIVFEKVKR